MKPFVCLFFRFLRKLATGFCNITVPLRQQNLAPNSYYGAQEPYSISIASYSFSLIYFQSVVYSTCFYYNFRCEHFKLP